jgi:hypothetical protein
MNEFTKEELEYLYVCLDVITERNGDYDDHKKLFDKIQSMIDGKKIEEESPKASCEHQEWDRRYASVRFCLKCNKIL